MSALDCQTCGACCVANGRHDEGYVDLDAPDLVRLRAVERRRHRSLTVVVSWHGHPQLRTQETHDGTVCGQLRGRLGAHVRCSIYRARPAACRAFVRGGDVCLAARREAGVER